MINDPEYISVMDFSEVVRTVEELDSENIVSIKKTYKTTPKNIVSTFGHWDSPYLWITIITKRLAFIWHLKNYDFGIFSIF